MAVNSERIAEIRPDMIRRRCGGWLAVAPDGACFSMGVTAPTEEEAREKFGSAFGRWLEIICDPRKAAPT